MSKKIKKVGGMKYYVVISLVAVLAITTAVIAYSVSNTVGTVEGDYNYYEAEGQVGPEDIQLGAFSGPDIYSYLNVYGSLTTGGGQSYATTTRDATHTFTMGDLMNYTYWDIMNEEAANSNLTFTMPATSTMMQILPEVGSTRTWLIHNATTTENTLTIAAGAGMDLVDIDAGSDALAAASWLEMTCTQIVYRADNNENIVCVLEENVDSD